MVGEFKSVTIAELSKDNKRMCLSALRVFGKCDECRVMKDYFTDLTRTKPLGIKSCESAIINEERAKILKKKRELLDKIKAINEQINQLKL